MPEHDLDRVEQIFHDVLELPDDEKTAYLTLACNGDDHLRAEVLSLIASHENDDSFIAEPALELGLSVLSRTTKQSLAGQTIGNYKIISCLGKGGMGEVYLAEDERLGRKVALKFLSPELIGDNWAKRQLVKEAQAVARFDHPNVCAVYGLEQHQNHHFIVMQYIEGQTLAQLIRSKALGNGQIQDLAQQIVGAIAEAHAHGIIHRDIKPGNIMVTPAGQVKVLDFGLAKVIQQKQNLENAAESVTERSQLGVFQGTVAYMSPEQLRGEKLDFRTDVFSIGTALYEMISGTNPHACGTEAEIISFILSQKPVSLNRTSSRVSHQLDATILKCLEKDKEARYQSAAELLLRLQSIQSVEQPSFQVRRFFNTRTFIGGIALLLVAVVLVYIYYGWRQAKAIVVFPIRNETGDANLEYLADGFTDSLTNRLTGLSNLRVRATSLVFGYKNKDVNPLKVGQDLSADGILVGKISGREDLPVLQVSLIRTSDGSEVWRSQYSVADMQKVFEIERLVAKSVVDNLESASAENESRISKPRDPQNPEARREYWQGLYYWRQRNNDGSLEKAIAHFATAIELEPTYARAHAGLSDCYAYLNAVAYGKMDTRTAMTKAEKSARDALDLDPELAEAHTSLAVVNLKYFWNWQEAEKEFKLAIGLKPDYFHAHYGYSMLLTILGRHEESIKEGQIAKDLDPFSPAAGLNYCRTLYFAHRFDPARQCYDNLVVEWPNYTFGQYARGLVYLRDGVYPEALAIFERMYERDRRLAGAFLGYTYAITGRQKDAERVIGELQQEKNLPPQELAFIYIGLGRMNEALDQLQRSAEERYAPFPFLATDPLFPKLQTNPRFVELVQRYSLPVPSAN
jgi:serine/threonine protein kinase